MNQLLFSVLLATVLVLTGGAALLLGLIALAGIERANKRALMQRVLCRLTFDRLNHCETCRPS